MAKVAKIDYDEENDILYLNVGEKVKDSLEIDNFVLDFSHDDKVVGVEIFDASKIVSKLSLLDIDKNILSNIIEANLSMYQSKDLLYVIVVLVLNVADQRKEVSIQVPAPRSISVSE